MTGFGRTGKWFASSHWDVVPEIMTLSKGINSGYLPLGAVMTNSKITGIFDDKILYAGLTQCAAAAAAIELVKDRETKEPLVPRTANSYENKPQILKELLGRLKEEGLKSRVYEGNPFNEQLIQCLFKEVWKWILYSRELIEVN